MISVNQVLEDLHELLRVHPSLKRNKLEVNRLQSDVTVKVNGIDFIQILLNLSINALQADDRPHDVVITGEIQERPLDLYTLGDSPTSRVVNQDGFANSDPLLAVKVSDTGPGIMEDVLARMFESQFTTKAVGEGTGLGLSIVKRLVTEANGLLHLESTVGQGTTFTLYLPAHRAA